MITATQYGTLPPVAPVDGFDEAAPLAFTDPTSPAATRAMLLADWVDEMARARARPHVDLYDKNWDESVPIVGETACEFVEKLNDSGETQLRLLGSNSERQWIVDELGEWEDLHIRIRAGYLQWTGKATAITDEGSDNGFEYIDIAFIAEYEHAKSITVYCNPLSAAEFQYPKIFALIGPTVFNAALTAFLNLLRRFGLPWTFGDNFWDPASWIANFNPANWPIVVVPKPFFSDTSMWTVIASRMGNLHDVLAPALHQAGVHFKVYRWFPGMPQPAPDHYILTRPTLVFDVIDKSGYVGPSGTIFDGLLSLVTEVADDLVNEVARAVSPTDPPEYSIGGLLGTTKTTPWVTHRNARMTGGLSGVQRWKMIRHKATASAIVTGGRSPDWVNSGIKLLLNAALGYLGALIGNPGLALGIFDGQVEDVVLAFDRISNPILIERVGKLGPPLGERFESGAGTGGSFSAIQAIRAGFMRARAYTAFEVETLAGRPHWPGAHYDVGDRNAVEVGRQLHVERVYQLGGSWSRTQDLRYRSVIGDGRVDQNPESTFDFQIGQIKAIIQAQGVAV